MSDAAQLRTAFFEENLRDLNRLVFAAEALEAPAMPDVPNWERESPESFELDRELTLGQACELGLAWQELAVKLHDMLTELALDEFDEELTALRDKAKAARLALIRLDSYDPPPPGTP